MEGSAATFTCEKNPSVKGLADHLMNIARHERTVSEKRYKW
jgi:hypothetical protein